MLFDMRWPPPDNQKEYLQCELHAKVHGGVRIMTIWLPVEQAIINKKLTTLKDGGGIVWTVVSVGTCRMKEDVLRGSSTSYEAYRERKTKGDCS